MVFGLMIQSSSPMGNLLTISLVDVIVKVVCMAFHTYCESSLCHHIVGRSLCNLMKSLSAAEHVNASSQSLLPY